MIFARKLAITIMCLFRNPVVTSYRCGFQGSAMDECGNDRNCGTHSAHTFSFYPAFNCRYLWLLAWIEFAYGTAPTMESIDSLRLNYASFSETSSTIQGSRLYPFSHG